jgi:hypothetical protein
MRETPVLRGLRPTTGAVAAVVAAVAPLLLQSAGSLGTQEIPEILLLLEGQAG